MHNEDFEGTTEGGALVPAELPAARPAPAPRPLASFVTQLIACHGRLPPYRERRRAPPEEAGERYRDAGRPPAARGRLVRSL
jgi:hypothetical protein